MIGFRGRIGFLLPPGNPTVEPEMMELSTQGVSLHFTRMNAEGPAGTHFAQEERNRSQVASIDSCMKLITMVRPDVVVMAHTATSYTLGPEGEAELKQRIEREHGTPFITAFESVLAALAALGAKRVALGTPYGEDMTLAGKALLERHGIEVVSYGRLQNVTNIYDETTERAYRLARSVDTEAVEAIYLSGVGMPTVPILQTIETDLGKPAISAAGCMMWNALRTIGVDPARPGYGRLYSGAS